MGWFALARIMIVATVAYSAALLQPLPLGLVANIAFAVVLAGLVVAVESSLRHTPALLVLGAPLGFRGTCYYYRKAYYRAFFADPMACAVGEPRGSGYTGEASFPFVLQNIHRYLIYLAIPILFFLWVDIVRGFIFDGRFGIGVGSFMLLASNLLLTLYTFSCHSLRHLLGGRVDCFSCVVAGGPRHQVWRTSSWLNAHHMAWAWWSLFFVCAADLYVRLCAMGAITDPRLM